MSNLGPLDDYGPERSSSESQDVEDQMGVTRPRKMFRLRPPLYLLQDKVDAIRNFSPSLFIMSSTTGLEGLLFAICPYFGAWRTDVGFAIWWLSVVVFVAFFCCIIARIWVLRRDVHGLAASRDPDLFFLALVVIAFVILVEGFAHYLPHYFGHVLYIPSIALWWLGWALSISMMTFIPFCLAQFSTAELRAVLPLWILMTVPGSATAAVGGELTGIISEEYFSAARHVAYGTIISLGFSLGVATIIILLVAQRILLQGFPPHGMIMSVFFPVAPLALLSDAFLELSVGLPRLFGTGPGRGGELPSDVLGIPAISTLCVFASLLIFGFTIWWMLMAVSAIATALFTHRHIPYGPAWWGAAFPVGLNAFLAFRLSEVLDLGAFRIVGAGLSIVSLSAWAATFTVTTCYAYSGRLFIKPGTRVRPKAGGF